ncbi:MAG: histidine phosphatase family protein [Solirubrobacterales bacterium]
MRIYIARHGQTVWNTEHRMQGWRDSELSEKGIADAKRLASRIQHIQFDSIISSPLGRALNTAQYVKGDKEKEIVIVDSFKEMNFGEWEGMYDSEVKEKYPVEHYNFWKKPELFKPLKGESFSELIARVDDGLKKLIEKNKDVNENILLVTHTCVIKSILSIIKAYKVEEFWNPPYIYATSLTILEVDNNNMKTILEADTSHLNI